MLYSIFKNNDTGVDYTQEDIVYMVTHVRKVVEAGLPYVFSDRNALLKYAKFSRRLEDLFNLVDMPLMEQVYWQDTETDKQRKERRMAEFLVQGCLPLQQFTGIAVHNEDKKAAIEKLLPHQGNSFVQVKKMWYFE